MHFSWFPGFHILAEKISVKVGYPKSGSSAKNLEQELSKEKLWVNNSLFSIFLTAHQSRLCWCAVAPEWNPNFVFTINVLIIRAELSWAQRHWQISTISSQHLIGPQSRVHLLKLNISQVLPAAAPFLHQFCSHFEREFENTIIIWERRDRCWRTGPGFKWRELR